VRCALWMVCRWRPLWQDHTLMVPSLPPVTNMDPPTHHIAVNSQPQTQHIVTLHHSILHSITVMHCIASQHMAWPGVSSHDITCKPIMVVTSGATCDMDTAGLCYTRMMLCKVVHSGRLDTHEGVHHHQQQTLPACTTACTTSHAQDDI